MTRRDVTICETEKVSLRAKRGSLKTCLASDILSARQWKPHLARDESPSLASWFEIPIRWGIISCVSVVSIFDDLVRVVCPGSTSSWPLFSLSYNNVYDKVCCVYIIGTLCSLHLYCCSCSTFNFFIKNIKLLKTGIEIKVILICSYGQRGVVSLSFEPPNGI